MSKGSSKKRSPKGRCRQACFYLSTSIVVVACVVLFVVLMKDVWDKYTAKMTSTGIRYSNEELEDKLMPCFTVYALPAYKTKGFHFAKEDFLQNTFNIDEFFDPMTLADLRNESLFDLSESLSIFYGRGYTFCYRKKVSAKAIKFIRLKTLFDTQLFIHAKGDEFLIQLSVYPTEITLISLNTQNEIDIIGADLAFAEVQTTLLYKDNMPCENYADGDLSFVECSRTKIWQQLRPKLNCSIVGMGGFNLNGSTELAELTECRDQGPML